MRGSKRCRLRDQLGNAKLMATKEGRTPIGYVDLRAGSGHDGGVAGQCKILQRGRRVVAEGDAAEVVQVRVMAVWLRLVRVGDAHDMAAVSVSELSGAR